MHLPNNVSLILWSLQLMLWRLSVHNSAKLHLTAK